MKNILLLILISMISIKAETIKWDDLTLEQKKIAKKLYKLGKPFDLGLTLVAIGYQESNLGKYIVNLYDPSCGVTHIHIKTYIKIHSLKDTPFLRNKYCSDLMNDLELSASVSIELLTYWKNYHKNNWAKVIKSYNGGFNINNKQVETYYNRIVSNVRELRTNIKELEKE